MSDHGKVVNIKKEKCDEYIGRGSPFGNPYIIGKDGDRGEVIKKYQKWFDEKIKDTEFRKQVLELRGKSLGCYCEPLPCHGDIIIKWLEDNKEESLSPSRD